MSKLTYTKLYQALLSLISDAESTDWQEAPKLGYDHSMIELAWSKTLNCYILCLANSSNKSTVVIASHILAIAASNDDLIFVADKKYGKYKPVGVISAQAWEQYGVPKLVHDEKQPDKNITSISKSTVAAYDFKRAPAAQSKGTFVKSAASFGISSTLTSPGVEKAAKLADKHGFNFGYDDTGWHVTPR